MQSRIDRLMSGITPGSAVLISAYPNIFYYSGFKSEDAYLLISNDRHMLITDSRYFVQAKREAADFDVVNIADGWEKIFSQISENDIFFEEQKLTFAEYEKFGTFGKTLLKGQKEIDSPRRIKDDNELKIISEAERIGDMAFTHILDFIRSGMTERDIALELEMFMKKQGASGLSFETIAASGTRSSMPHGVASDKVIEKGDFLTLDFGCVYEGYCSDMTRTVVIGAPDERQKEIYEVVLKAQETALANIAVGMDCAEIDALARDVIKDAGYGKNFGHSLGHSVGVEIHEQPCFSPKSKDILKEGNVLSVEPGIYIDEEMGVRIEDLIAVKDGKIVNLTSSPKNLIRI